MEHKAFPQAKGADFLTAAVSAYQEQEVLMSCPAADDSEHEGGANNHSVPSYAGRDNTAYPIHGSGYDEPLAACEIHNCVLFGDGSIQPISRVDSKASLILGPTSSVEELRKLTH